MTSRVQTQEDQVVDLRSQPPGEYAENPNDVSGGGWKAAAKRAVKNIKTDHVVLNAAGVAFFGFLASIPAMVALVSVYGLVGDPDTIERRVEDVAGGLPEEARQLLIQQLEAITGSSSSALTLGLVTSLGFALWSASSGMSHVVEAVNMAYDQEESRGFFARRGLSLLLTLGAIAFVIVAIAAITVLPAVLSAMDLTGPIRWMVSFAIWPLVGLGLMVGLAVLYRYAPDREPEAEWRWVSPGSVLAVVGWIVASIAFQIYVANFGSYNETYGSLGAIVVLLLWLLISAFMVLLGAELNSELEAQTSADTTK